MKVASATATSATHRRLFCISNPAPQAIRRTCTTYMYFVDLPCTVYSCQVGSEKLSRETVAEHALKLADTEGLDGVTIRRLATELGVTPMALYWHFKNKDELYLGIVDHAMTRVKATRDPSDPWLHQLRAMVEALITVMREHMSLPELLRAVDMQQAASFSRATNDALELLTRGGYSLEEGYWA